MRKKVIYDSDMGFYDALTRGGEYTAIKEIGDQYIIFPNDMGGKSTLLKDKFKEA